MGQLFFKYYFFAVIYITYLYSIRYENAHRKFAEPHAHKQRAVHCLAMTTFTLPRNAKKCRV